VGHTVFYTENRALLRYYAAYSGYSLPTFVATIRSRLQGLRNPRRSPAILRCAAYIEEDGTGRLSRNVGKELPLYVALYPRRAQISCTSRRTPEITYISFRWKRSSLIAIKETRLWGRRKKSLVIVKVNFVWINAECLVVSAGGIRISTRSPVTDPVWPRGFQEF